VAVDSGKNRKRAENVFRIMDDIIYQMNRTKKMFILMIVSIIIVVPATHFIVTFALVGNPFPDDGGPPHYRSGPPDTPAFRITQVIVVAVVLAWIVIGIRQRFLLSKWTKRYELYKELQKKIDEKLHYDENNNDEGKEVKSNNIIIIPLSLKRVIT
jgi:cell division protein FtsL